MVLECGDGSSHMIGVYGANGFIGRHVVKRLAERAVRVKAVSRHLDRDYFRAFEANVEAIEADFGDSLAMASSLQDVRTVVQLISTSSPGMQNLYNVSDIRDNVIPHVAFLQSCVAAGVQRYVFLSSGGTVYGRPDAVPIPESAANRPISSHGLTKLTVEKYIEMHGVVDGLEFVILRLSNPFGPGQLFRKAQGLIPAILARHSEGLPVRIIGDGETRRDYIFIDDVVDAIEAAIRSPAAANSILNIGSGEGRSVNEVVQAIESLLGVALAREHVPARPTDVDVNVLDIAKAAAVLDWTPSTSFAEGLTRTLQPLKRLPRSANSWIR